MSDESDHDEAVNYDDNISTNSTDSTDWYTTDEDSEDGGFYVDDSKTERELYSTWRDKSLPDSHLLYYKLVLPGQATQLPSAIGQPNFNSCNLIIPQANSSIGPSW